MGGRILQRNKSENGSSVIINGWKAEGIYDAKKGWVFWATINRSIQRHLTSCVTEHDELESVLPATIDQWRDELRESFVNVPFDEENSEWEKSDNENDVDSERNIFDDIIIDAKWIDNPENKLYKLMENPLVVPN